MADDEQQQPPPVVHAQQPGGTADGAADALADAGNHGGHNETPDAAADGAGDGGTPGAAADGTTCAAGDAPVAADGELIVADLETAPPPADLETAGPLAETVVDTPNPPVTPTTPAATPAAAPDATPASTPLPVVDLAAVLAHMAASQQAAVDLGASQRAASQVQADALLQTVAASQQQSLAFMAELQQSRTEGSMHSRALEAEDRVIKGARDNPLARAHWDVANPFASAMRLAEQFREHYDRSAVTALPELSALWMTEVQSAIPSDAWVAASSQAQLDGVTFAAQLSLVVPALLRRDLDRLRITNLCTR